MTDAYANGSGEIQLSELIAPLADRRPSALFGSISPYSVLGALFTGLSNIASAEADPIKTAQYRMRRVRQTKDIQ
jgi:hypothetical protein